MNLAQPLKPLKNMIEKAILKKSLFLFHLGISLHRSDFPNNLIILSETTKFKNSIGEGLAEIKSKSKKIPSNITTIKNFQISQEKDFLSYGTSAKNLYLILLEKGTI